MLDLGDAGVVPVTVGISQIVLPGNTATAVMGRMQASKKEEANLERSRGTAVAAGIRNRASTLANKLLAFADHHATDIKSKANAEAAKYMEEMAKDEELAMFLSWLDTLRATLSKGVTIVLPTNLEPFHMLDPNARSSSEGIPEPSKPLIPQTKPAGTRGGQ
jgi:regulator of protease activity HflC (stomatin/prohibitin superfamily)